MSQAFCRDNIYQICYEDLNMPLNENRARILPLSLRFIKKEDFTVKAKLERL